MSELAHSINSSYLLSNGWVHWDKNAYYKDGYVITYNGYQWRLGDALIQFVDELEAMIKFKKQ